MAYNIQTARIPTSLYRQPSSSIKNDNSSNDELFSSSPSSVSSHNKSMDNQTTARDFEVKLSRVTVNFTPAEIATLKATWSMEAKDTNSGDIADPKNTLFGTTSFWEHVYSLVGEEHPEVVHLLPPITHQTQAFSGMVYLCISNLDNLSRLDEYLASLGRRHSRVFNALRLHFEAMGSGVLKSLYNHYGEAFTADISDVWARFYCFLANSLLQASLYDPVMSQEKLTFPAVMKDNTIIHRAQVESESRKNMASAEGDVSEKNRSGREGGDREVTAFRARQRQIGSFASRLFARRESQLRLQSPATTPVPYNQV
ncbi:hypothetical protein BABINDRAFT_161163 [Babjeviella inositovora NRRL Y-12698]|uniref:Globin domain-containing protein n=1 Tax=Babjeviella inositovora NRRL Y-12698 TaxID=984486 RepID=A0A1E3QTC6_9ASCO|nr:uncharacterized protein BABINDRAFT_161163 [Babjeviella inositovora NRRL Y-12698]ODQ80187.1 hypothetical protein BABINDRAFT_161163 [Babjeviella inositovora NRRL Y-12698]